MKPGDKFLARDYKQGYEPGKEQLGEDINFTLLPTDGYESMIRADLSLLEGLEPSAVDGEFSLADITAAVEGLIVSRKKSIERYDAARDSGEPTQSRGPKYERVGGQLHTLDGEYYMIGLRSDKPKQTKQKSGAIPRAKEYVTRICDLPTRYYWFALKMEEGRFKKIELS